MTAEEMIKEYELVPIDSSLRKGWLQAILVQILSLLVISVTAGIVLHRIYFINDMFAHIAFAFGLLFCTVSFIWNIRQLYLQYLIFKDPNAAIIVTLCDLRTIEKATNIAHEHSDKVIRIHTYQVNGAIRLLQGSGYVAVVR